MERNTEAKLTLAHDMLAKDSLTPTATILQQMKDQYGSMVAPSVIHRIRKQEFGYKIGPRGKVIEVKVGEAKPKVDVPMVLTQASTVISNIKTLVKQLKGAMVNSNISSITVPQIGEAEMQTLVKQTF